MGFEPGGRITYANSEPHLRSELLRHPQSVRAERAPDLLRVLAWHRRLEGWYWSAFVGRIDAVIHLSEAGKHAVEARYPALAAVPHAIVPHGHYRH